MISSHGPQHWHVVMTRHNYLVGILHASVYREIIVISCNLGEVDDCHDSPDPNFSESKSTQLHETHVTCVNEQCNQNTACSDVDTDSVGTWVQEEQGSVDGENIIEEGCKNMSSECRCQGTSTSLPLTIFTRSAGGGRECPFDVIPVKAVSQTEHAMQTEEARPLHDVPYPYRSGTQFDAYKEVMQSTKKCKYLKVVMFEVSKLGLCLIKVRLTDWLA